MCQPHEDSESRGARRREREREREEGDGDGGVVQMVMSMPTNSDRGGVDHGDSKDESSGT